MSIAFQVVPLTDTEAESIVASQRFNSLHPVSCENCGATGSFERRIFRILGIKKSEYSDDTVQGLINHQFRQRYGIHYIFFKTHGNSYYADSAVCSNCKSTRVVFDIDLTHDILSGLAKATGRPLAEVRDNIERMAQSIDKGTKGTEPSTPINRGKRRGR